MPPQELLLHVFCLIDDEIKALGGPPRRPGPRPRLADSEVITIELVGELWGLADDAAILRHFRCAATRPSSPPWPRSTAPGSPATPPTSAGSSGRSSAGWPPAWAAPGRTGWSTSCPLPACRFGRAGYCRRFRGQAAYGFDPLARKAFYGFRLHLRASPDGVVLGYRAGAGRRPRAGSGASWPPPRRGWRWGTATTGARRRARSSAPPGATWRRRSSQGEHDPEPERSRRCWRCGGGIETVFSHLIEWFDCRRIKVRDLWHLEHRLVRKILALTVAGWLGALAGRPPLQIKPLVA